MSPRTGRPPKENAKTCRLEIRLTPSELKRLSELAEKFHMSKSGLVMYALEVFDVHFCGDN